MSIHERYNGKRAALYCALLYHDPWDQFAWCQEWRFAIADYLLTYRGQTVPGFIQGPMGPDEDSFAYDELTRAEFSDSELWYAYNILTRFREWLRIAGKDY